MSNPPEPPSPAESSDFVPIGHYPGTGKAFEMALVVLAMGLACQVEKAPDDDGFMLLVDPDEAGRIGEEFAIYEQEQAQPAPVLVEPREFDAGTLPTALWVLCLCIVFWLQRENPEMIANGVSAPREIFQQGEWWRTFTALFLHADIMHLIGNIASGVLFGIWVCRSIGPWLGWTLILAAGALGNALNAASRVNEAFSSLGASTAVFGALGILTGFAVFQATRDRYSVRSFRRLVPLAGGLVLLSLMGVGSDPRTDVGGHVCGFFVGIFLGLFAAWLRRKEVVVQPPHMRKSSPK